jgi:hypothetical protein
MLRAPAFGHASAPIVPPLRTHHLRPERRHGQMARHVVDIEDHLVQTLVAVDRQRAHPVRPHVGEVHWLIRIMEAGAGNHQRIEHRDAVDTGENGLSQSRTLATRRAADDGRAFRTGEDPGLYARFRWEYARHDPHKPHRDVALRALRFAHEESSVPLHRHSSNTPTLDDSKIIHTRPCNLGVLLNTTSPGQSHRGAGASLLTAVRLPWRVDLLTRLIYVPSGESS